MENIYTQRALPAGNYRLAVNQFCPREKNDSGFTVEVEVNGETHTFSRAVSQGSGSVDLPFAVGADGTVVFADNGLAKTSVGVVKWGLKTGIWHNVRALTLSPNHWTKPSGNKHWFFLLEGCVSDEKTRPFYNEFLDNRLAADRKVCELVGGKLEVMPADGAELSGLGFSSTLRNHVFVEVEGAFKRVVKVLF